MSNFSLKHPPPFERDEKYEVWKRDVELWQEFTDLSKSKQAIAVNLFLRGRARVAASEVPIAVNLRKLKSKQWMNLLVSLSMCHIKWKLRK